MTDIQIYKSIKEIDTRFCKHIDILVDKEGEKPSKKDIKVIRQMIPNGKYKWFNVTGLGYDKNWMCVYGY